MFEVEVVLAFDTEGQADRFMEMCAGAAEAGDVVIGDRLVVMSGWTTLAAVPRDWRAR